ncbi:hypothetical protein JCM21900_005573 [Sporobolomyces salmonicolor]
MSYAGGGFLDSGGASQSSPGGGRRAGPSALRPVVINQILTAQQAFNDAEFEIDGSEAKEITLVACIRNISKTTTQVTLLIEDGTGQIDARMWIDPEAGDADARLESLEINKYVRIIGLIKTFSNKRHVNAQRVRPLDDMNEINFHLVEVAYVHLYNTRGPPGGANPHAITDRPYDSASNPYAGGATLATSDAANTFADLPAGQRAIMKYVVDQVRGNDAGDEGVNVNAIVRAVNAPEEQVRRQVSVLCDEGHLYQTIDDDHVLPTST